MRVRSKGSLTAVCFEFDKFPGVIYFWTGVKNHASLCNNLCWSLLESPQLLNLNFLHVFYIHSACKILIEFGLYLREIMDSFLDLAKP